VDALPAVRIGADRERPERTAQVVGDTLRELAAGTAAGRSDRITRAAALVVRVEHMRVANASGLRWLNMGGTAPWLSNGVTGHKRAWGGEVVDRGGNHRVVLVGWRRWAPVARFLASYPLLVRRPWGFGAATAAADHAAADLQAA
jgi:hypothetical protein